MERVDDVADPQRELLERSVDAGVEDGLGELGLRLRQRGLGARLLRRQQCGDMRIDRLLFGPNAEKDPSRASAMTRSRST